MEVITEDTAATEVITGDTTEEEQRPTPPVVTPTMCRLSFPDRPSPVAQFAVQTTAVTDTRKIRSGVTSALAQAALALDRLAAQRGAGRPDEEQPRARRAVAVTTGRCV